MHEISNLFWYKSTITHHHHHACKRTLFVQTWSHSILTKKGFRNRESPTLIFCITMTSYKVDFDKLPNFLQELSTLPILRKTNLAFRYFYLSSKHSVSLFRPQTGAVCRKLPILRFFSFVKNMHDE